MATLRVPDQHITLHDKTDIETFLHARGIAYETWSTEATLPSDPGQEEILAAYHHHLHPLMKKRGYHTADVIRVDRHTPHLEAIRDRFNREHTHSEDEVRFFVDGHGVFWFHTNDTSDEVFSVLCVQGDMISVPADSKHWFELGDDPHVRAIRLFTNVAGWVPQYTGSGLDQRYR